ncbi:serine/threonine-protein kinase 36 [Cololabis saira]|uniref:serine/threonine-protein kinase 36 n=1 Tax=Cololabis saira TaxID=129043 RepID=UPI002AD4C84F|nr:serine/threonine-protein kinase 36 [Cololabis saira]
MDRYHVLKLVGEGSFGRVFKGRKKFTGQVVALKFMPKVNRSEKELGSLKREIEILRDLQHPNIVQLFDSFETDTEVVVVTEYAEGQLFQILEDDGNLPESQVREIACQLVSALYYLHSHRILHRDMKPQNILLGKTGVVKLCDFGFARAMSVSTLVLTSIKGTPLYMSPELVEEKPYDHTADLWSLGCILYELHTGEPPFYTNSIFHLVQLIVRGQVKWPDNNMSSICQSFLKGLLTKDPQRRLSWPDLLHHPFVADGVLVLSDTNVFNPLTVTPSPDIQALKLKQVAERSVPTSGRSKFLWKVMEQENKRKPKKERRTERANSATAEASPNIPESPSREVSSAPGHSVLTAANQSINPRSRASTRAKQRGQISRDYEQEFPSVEVGPRLLRWGSEDRNATPPRQDVDDKEFWENLAQQSDPNRFSGERFNYKDVLPQIKSRIAAFQAQVIRGGVLEDARQVCQLLKVLRNLILTPDLKMLSLISRELELPRVLFDAIRNSVENPDFIKQQGSVPVLGEMMTLLLIYWEKNSDWIEEESSRLEEFTKPFHTVLTGPDLTALAPLAACVLSLFTQHVDVHVDLDHVTSLLTTRLLDSNEVSLLPCGWGLWDGLLSLVLHSLSTHENARDVSNLNSVRLVEMWEKIGTSLASAKPNLELCSAHGFHSLLSITVFVLTRDLSSCIPLFTDSRSNCVHTLGRLLTDRLPHALAGPDAEPSRDGLTILSCQLLCFPFALDLQWSTTCSVLQLYDSCGVVSGLLQVIQTLPLPLLEVPLSLLSRLFLCDPQRALSHLREAALSFFSSHQDRRSADSRSPTPRPRTSSSLLCALLQPQALWDSAAELLTLLSQVAGGSRRPGGPRVHVEASTLQQALTHPYDRIRAATCRLLGSLNPLAAPAADPLQADVFKNLLDRVWDPHMSVRRTACWAVGNWLGYVAESPGIRMSRSDGKGMKAIGWGDEKELNKHVGLRAEAAGSLETVSSAQSAESGGWTGEVRRSAAVLAGLLTDPDTLTRRHCCAALRNLLNIDGAASALLEEDVPNLLLRVACSDSHNAVRQAAIATLSLYIQRDEMCQVLMSLDASEKLLQASQHAPPQCDYKQLLRLLPKTF